MRKSRLLLGLGLGVALTVQAGCGAFGGLGGKQPRQRVDTPPVDELVPHLKERKERAAENGTIWDIFKPRGDQGQVGAVNKYIWNASLEVLDFLPVQSVDPFTGVISTGYGTAPGGGRAYRATIYVTDAALDARSLNVALMTRSGPASASTVRAIEDAILTRARQLRARDSKL